MAGPQTISTRLAGALVVFTAAAGDGEEPLRFNRDVRPILSEHCFECHGPDAAARQAELRLDSAEHLTRDRGGQRVVVPGDKAASELLRRVFHPDPSERMPPPDHRNQLDDIERALLARWIEEGGQSEGHWAYQPPVRSRAPSDGAAGTIDALLQRAARAVGVEPAPPADRRTLARRLHLDLLGLPPEPRDVTAFLEDERPDAYERLVDRLLASPHYGERMAQFWLDLVRYADTVGYHGDQAWRVWPYRDWVIRAFNENMPFDRFTIEQLGGDLLPGVTLGSRVGSTYNRLNMVTFEGGSQAKEFLLKYAADRVRTTSEAWLGSTMGCAECHDHKFDPFTSRDFYSLSAYFADIKEEGVFTRFQDGFVPPELPVPSQEHKAALETNAQALERARAAVAADLPQHTEPLRAWTADMRHQLSSSGESQDVVWLDDEQTNGGTNSGAWNFVGADQGPVKSGERSRRQQGAGIVQHYFDDAERKLTPGEGDRFFAWVWLDPDDPPQQIMLQFNDGTWEHRAFWGEDRISFGGIGTEGPQHHAMGPLPSPGQWARLEVDPSAVGFGSGSAVDGMAFTQFGGVAYWDAAGLHSARPSLAFGGPPAEILALLESKDPEQDEVHSKLASYWRSVAPELAPQREAISKLETQRKAIEDSIPKTLATVSLEPRMVRILPRGNWMDESGEEVEPGTPGFLPRLPPAAERGTRLDLGRWLVAPENPLTARVLVNRLWRLFHGEGISRSVDDTGSQGQWPDHPELLDNLTLDLVESGWDIKAMVRRMVTSKAYRRSSAPTPDLARADPENRLFARQNRRRLDAEQVRDVVLAAAGLLVRDIGGPSVKPYQPAGYWRELNFPKRTWQHDTGPALYRRGLYTFWCRTFLHPTLRAFDAPTRESCTAARPVSNTPLQALALLNDPAFVEAALALALRTVQEVPSDDDARLDFMYERVLSRAPRDLERGVLLELLRTHRTQYAADPEAARLLCEEGQITLPPSALETDELAAWISVSRVLFNTGEAISRR